MKNSIKKTSKKGGKVLASGGFGCIFKPALRCKTMKNERNAEVSKLMKKKYVTKEYGEILKYLPELKSIPNYQNYFLVEGFSTCDPAPLGEEDKDNFDEKCRALTKNGYTRENVNKRLGELKIISMPYGGIDVGDYLDSVGFNYEKLHELNESLQLLLKNGILPMNKKGIYHCDIKDSNVLAQTEDKKVFTRLIDWGLSTLFTTEKTVPAVLLNRPFQFNILFSNILFNNSFTKMYNEFLKNNPNPDYITIRSFVINFTITWVDERGPGHLRNLNGIFKDMFGDTLKNVEDKFKEDIIEYNYTFYFIFEYLSQILFKFTNGNTFDQMKYFTEVFLKNIDVWGFVMIYIPIFEYLHKNYKRLNPIELDMFHTIKSIMLLVMGSSAEPIDIDKLEDMLKKLGALFEKAKREKINFGRLKRPSSSSSSKTKKQKGGSVIKYYHKRKSLSKRLSPQKTPSQKSPSQKSPSS